eukprot:XP_025014555.1 protein BRICK 1 isoform X1 [Ricinus communis]
MARAGGITNAVNVGIAVQADWENREFISHISLNVRRLFDFLLQFEATTKSKLASLNEKLDTLERRLELLEVQVGFVPEVTNKQQEKEKLDILIVLTLCRCYLTLGPGGRVGQEYDQVHDNRCNPIVGQLATLWPF